MAEAEAGDDFETEETNYKAPEKKALHDIRKLDQHDESLNRMKEKLIGAKDPDPVFPDNPSTVIVKQLVVLVDGRPDAVIKLDGDISDLKKNPITLKEGTKYKVAVHFFVQREMVFGLRHVMETYRKGILVDSESKMVGSYGPKEHVLVWTSREEEAPKGLISRGSYTVESKFIDDDKVCYLSWEWGLEIKKDW